VPDCTPQRCQDGHYRQRRDSSYDKAEDRGSDGPHQPCQQASNGRDDGTRGVAYNMGYVFRPIDAVRLKPVDDDATPNPKHGNHADETQPPKERRYGMDRDVPDGT